MSSSKKSSTKPYFITNQERLVSDVFERLMPSSRQMDFLVGFFYFSGFLEIYRKLDKQDQHIRILIGLDAEKALLGKVREFEWMEESARSRAEVKSNFYHSVVSLFNDTSFFDSKPKQDAFLLFIEKLKNGTLELKKTLYPNHAKLYLFHNKEGHDQEGEFPGSVVTGSSNLSREGLRGRFEINVLSRERAHFEEAKELFEKLWKEAVAVADSSTQNEFLTEVVEKIWINKLPDPFLLYVRVLQEYFQEPDKELVLMPANITDGEFLNLKYQTDAIKRAIEVLERHGGVIIADVVGLGKSIIASTVARNLGLKTIIIAPPHLKKQWDEYRFGFGFNARVYSSGAIDKALIENLSVRDHLIIIDEAHKYRNELTQDYVDLHKICQRNKVMLLTATPFNNRPQDVFSMIKLFQIPSRTTLQTVDNLSWHFQNLVREYKDIHESQRIGRDTDEVTRARIRDVADQIRGLLGPLIIRRSRIDLEAIEDYKKDLESQGISFPKVNDPKSLEYELGPLSELYKKTLNDISPEDGKKGFVGARYMPVNYLKDIAAYRKRISKDLGLDENLLQEVQINLAAFMKKLLVRRFESSFLAFQITLDSMIKSTEVAMDWYVRLGKIPIYKKGALPDLDDLAERVELESDKKLRDVLLEEELAEYRERGLLLIDKKEIKVEYFEKMERDLDLLQKTRIAWFGKAFPADPKLARLKKILSESLVKEPRRKIVIFSEFADTVSYLNENLKVDFRVFKYTAADASEANKKIIRENFDAGYPQQKNEFDILIATDAISEGYNLHRAGAVFNYDIPYNPTRVIQRVGRINRINKKVFDELFIFNFFPTATGERETGIRRVSTLKMAMIHALFGEDTKVLTSDEELESFFAEQFQTLWTSQEELSPESKYEDFIRRLRKSNPEIIEQSLKVPKRVRIGRSVPKSKKGIVLFARKGKEYAFRLSDSVDKAPDNLQPHDAFALFEADQKEKARTTSKNFDRVYEKAIGQLFVRKSQTPLDRSKGDTLNKIRVLMDKLPAEKDYLEDLRYVFQELDSLPDRFAKAIRALDTGTLETDFADLKREIPPDYLSAIVEREKQISESNEDVILSEELP